MKALLSESQTTPQKRAGKTASLRLELQATHQGRGSNKARRSGKFFLLLAASLLLLLGLFRLVWPFHYQKQVVRWSDEHGVDPYLVASVALHESRFRPGIVSEAGAVGLMQLMPDTARWLDARHRDKDPAEVDLRSVDDNIRLGSLYLAELLRLYEEDEVTALAAYNAGPGVVARWSAGRKFLRLEDVAYPETRHYIRKVRAGRRWLKMLYPVLPAGSPKNLKEST